jgi:hypothetical protein
MTVMKVRIVRVLVSQWRVSVLVGVGFARRVVRLVIVLVMLVVNMTMFVIQRLMSMFMLVALREVEINTYRH